MQKALRQLIRSRLNHDRKRRLRPLQSLAYSVQARGNLCKLATLNKSDKWNDHWFAQHYQTHFHALRKKRLVVLEIGIGGYHDPFGGGGSLRLWRTYFPNSLICGIDIEEKSYHDEKRIRTFQGSQIDEPFLQRVIDDVGPPDIIIDDGSHLNEHVLASFQFLFPRMKAEGFYVVEDTQTSYWPSWGGNAGELNDLRTSMGFFKSLVDGLNSMEFERHGGPDYFDQNIVAMHFYHNMVFVKKAPNNEVANMRESPPIAPSVNSTP